MRRKINAHLRNPEITQAVFLRELGKMFPQPRKIQSKQLHDFLSKKGPSSGNSSCVYYAAYVYFEKLRIKEGKKKSQMRLDLEGIYSYEGGMSRKLRVNESYVVSAGKVPAEDKYGRIRSVPEGVLR